MMHSNQALYDELRATLIDIDKQIAQMKEDFQSPVYKVEPNLYKIKDRFGGYILAPLLAAKATTLSAMVEIKNAQIKITQNPPKRPGPRGGW